MKYILTLTFAESATPEQVRAAFVKAAEAIPSTGVPLVGTYFDLGRSTWSTEAETARLERKE